MRRGIVGKWKEKNWYLHLW